MSGTSLLSIQDLSVSFVGSGGITEAVQHISLNVNKGETVALVGESGSGKSVTALSVVQLLPYPAARHPSGSIAFDGIELCGAPKRRLEKIRGNRISMIFQEPMTSLNPLHTVEKQIGEILLLHKKMDMAAARKRVVELLELVELEEITHRLGAYPHELSGGQRQRVMIAMALANEPDLLIADEPTTALDVTVQAQILKLLRDLQDRLSMAMLLITHDLEIVRAMASRTYVMEAGRIVEDGKTETLFYAPTHPYTQKLLAARPRGRLARGMADTPVLLAAQDLKVWFPVKKGFFKKTVAHIKAVDGVDITLRSGRTVGVVGESGSGKTTLGMALLRLERSSGDISFDGRDFRALKSANLRTLRQEMQIMFQDPFSSLSPRLSVGEIVAEGLDIHRLAANRVEREKKVAAALEDVGLSPDIAGRYPHEFSGGQRQRIAIARAIILRPRLVILDEPTSALDISVQAQIIDLLRDLQERYGLAYMFISHDLRVVRAMADEVIVLRHGKVVEQGLAEDIFDQPRDPYTKVLMAAAFELRAVPTTAGSTIAG